MLISWWRHSNPSIDHFLRSLAALSDSYPRVDIQIVSLVKPNNDLQRCRYLSWYQSIAFFLICAWRVPESRKFKIDFLSGISLHVVDYWLPLTINSRLYPRYPTSQVANFGMFFVSSTSISRMTHWNNVVNLQLFSCSTLGTLFRSYQKCHRLCVVLQSELVLIMLNTRNNHL